MNKISKKALFGVACAIFSVATFFGVNNAYASDMFLKLLDGSQKTIEIDEETATVGDVREAASEKLDKDIRGITLVFAGKFLTEDDKTLAELNIQKESTFHVLIKNIYNITYHLNGGEFTDDVVDYYIEGTSLMLSDSIERDGYSFAGWMDNEDLDGDSVDEITTEDTGNKEFWAKWIEDDPSQHKSEYTVQATQGDAYLTFKETAGGHYQFDSVNVEKFYTDEKIGEIASVFGVDAEEVKAQLNDIISWAKKAAGKATYLRTYEMYLSESGTYIHEVAEGFTIRIKLTDDIKGYNSYKFININESDGTVGETVTLKVEDGFLVGTLPHLSFYVLVGEKDSSVKSPDTGFISSEEVSAKTAGTEMLWIVISTLFASFVTVKFAQKYTK